MSLRRSGSGMVVTVPPAIDPGEPSRPSPEGWVDGRRDGREVATGALYEDRVAER